MSSILKALKKLEEEKAARQGQRVDITRDIFGSGQQPAAAPRWPLIAAGVVGAGALSLTAMLYVGRQESRPAPLAAFPETRQGAMAPSLPVVDQPLLTPPPERALPPSAPPSRPAPPVAVTPPSPPRNSPSATATAPSYRTQVISTNRPFIAPLPATTAARAVTNVAPSPTAAAAATATPNITVSGIAYNKDAGDRLAVINGVPVGEGKSVGGVKVEEIMPDKVRFSQGGQSFEVLIGRSNH